MCMCMRIYIYHVGAVYLHITDVHIYMHISICAYLFRYTSIQVYTQWVCYENSLGSLLLKSKNTCVDAASEFTPICSKSQQELLIQSIL